MPPATITSWSPARIIASAISTARMLDAHTLLTVSAGTSIGNPAPIAACRAGAWPAPPCEHLAHDDVLDVAVLDVHALERAAYGNCAQLGRLLGREAAAELPERRADR